MAENRRVVFGDAPSTERLPDWSRDGALTIEGMRASGAWNEAQERLQIQREGGYAGIDALQFLIYFFGAGLGIGVKELSQRARPYHKEMAAIGGRRRLPTQSSMSRLLSAAQAEDVREFGAWLLREAPGLQTVLNHPSALTRDALGAGWHVFDWDPTVTTLRHRALPVFDDMPDGRRRSAGMAEPGYPGRKRGDVQFSRATLQHAGSALWLGVRTAPGNGEVREAFHSGIDDVVATCQHADLPPDRAIIRADGVAGNVPFITACHEGGVRYITRLAHYQLLQDPKIVEHLNQGAWREVPSSGSGPTRHAADVGFVTLEPSSRVERADGGGQYEPIRTRVVVSRFPCDGEGRGTGQTLDGWHYELFATDLDASAWPDADVVAGYYGRCGQENRFAQEDRELGLDRIFSYHLPGQELATIVGLFVWNWRICRGMELADPSDELPEQQPILRPQIDTTAGLPRPWSPHAEATLTPEDEEDEPSVESAAEVADEDGEQMVSTADTDDEPETLQEALDRLDWPSLLEGRPDWKWSTRFSSLKCPADQFIPFQRIEMRGQTTRTRFVAEPGTCDDCPLRSQCVSSNDPRYRKDIRQPVPDEDAAILHRLWDKVVAGEDDAPSPTRPGQSNRKPSAKSPIWRVKRLSWLPPANEETPPLQVTGPLLLPAELRKLITRETRSVDVRVRVEVPEVGPLSSPVLARSAADRQHRRLTWTERLLWNALPDDADVELRFDGARRLTELLRPPEPAQVPKITPL